MNPEERKQKILQVTQDGYRTRTAIHRAIGGGQTQVYAMIERMVREGLLERGEDVRLGNQLKGATYRAKSAPPLADKQPAEVFHGRAPSVFAWRGNFGLRS